MSSFKAFRIHSDPQATRAGFETLTLDDLTAGDVVIRASYSSINYKDALAATGKGKILRKSPLVGGIDVSGIVETSTDPRFQAGDAVLVCGANLSEDFDGGYSELVRVAADAVVALPDGLSLWDAMAIGTAGFTAALAVQRLQDNHQQPSLGPVLVTGASGGVGSYAIDLLSNLGFEVVALSSKQHQVAYLQQLGANRVLSPKDLEMGTRALEKAIWGGAVDNLGGDILSYLTRSVRPFGNIAAVGLASGIALNTTVMPFILRGVSLIGINSVLLPNEMRARAWQALANQLKPRHIQQIATRTIEFNELPQAFAAYIEGSVTGRTVVRIGAE